MIDWNKPLVVTRAPATVIATEANGNRLVSWETSHGKGYAFVDQFGVLLYTLHGREPLGRWTKDQPFVKNAPPPKQYLAFFRRRGDKDWQPITSGQDGNAHRLDQAAMERRRDGLLDRANEYKFIELEEGE